MYFIFSNLDMKNTGLKQSPLYLILLHQFYHCKKKKIQVAALNVPLNFLLSI